MFHQHTKRVIRHIRRGSRPTFLLANRGFPSSRPSTYYFLGCNCFLLGSATIVVRNPQTIPTGGQNFFDYVLEFIRDVSKIQIGEEYGPWVPLLELCFYFFFFLISQELFYLGK
ncbi:hypothetical protein ACP275_02G094900 [Erythranthe tilingii]